MAASTSALPTGCTNFKLRRLTRRVSRHYDRILGAAGLKTTQYSLLSHLVGHGPLPSGELARRLDMEPSTLTRNLRPLVAQGWAEIGAGGDGRTRLVAATAAGCAKRVEAEAVWRRAQTTFNERLGSARVAQLHALLDECLDLVNEAGADDDE